MPPDKESNRKYIWGTCVTLREADIITIQYGCKVLMNIVNINTSVRNGQGMREGQGDHMLIKNIRANSWKSAK